MAKSRGLLADLDAALNQYKKGNVSQAYTQAAVLYQKYVLDRHPDLMPPEMRMQRELMKRNGQAK